MDIHLWWWSRAFWPPPRMLSHVWGRRKPHWDFWKGLLHFALTGSDVHQHYRDHTTRFLPQAVHPACNACQNQIFFVKDLVQLCHWQYLEWKLDGAAPWHADGLDEAATALAWTGGVGGVNERGGCCSSSSQMLPQTSSGTTAKYKWIKSHISHFVINTM